MTTKVFKTTLLLLLLSILPMTIMAQNGKDEVKISKIRFSERYDTMRVDFKLMRDGKKFLRSDILKKKAAEIFNIQERGISAQYLPIVDSLIDISNRDSRMDNLDIMLLIDHGETVNKELLMRQTNITEQIVYAYGNEARVFVSFMYNQKVTETEQIDTSNFLIGGIKRRICSDEEMFGGGKLLFKSVLSKLEEMSNISQTYFPNVDNSFYFKDNGDREKIIFVFTDGVFDDKSGEPYGGLEDYSKCKSEYITWMKERDAGIPV